ncbi:hypothetical protein CANCADRAFT_86908 [Tortispora caseinolytica NRRL Y-17796]|uniref:Lysophospholipase n=1 Tax=Tortispora caseinolytica NRRL Y-17796 TaxID=767744 RepID=A0A1E4TL30_9ASCO|nr:hypothetical protein CANCADRAFT_86908 [Tortispora caseinolytica NRRL Y-17796]
MFTRRSTILLNETRRSRLFVYSSASLIAIGTASFFTNSTKPVKNDEPSSDWVQAIKDRWISAIDSIQKSKNDLLDFPNLEESAYFQNLRSFFTSTYLTDLQRYIEKLQSLAETTPDSLGGQILASSKDANLHPEILKTASVRFGNGLCTQEQQFLANRRQVVKKSLASFLDIPLDQIDDRDVPVVGLVGSGGGYRAMTSTAGYLKAAKQAGLFDCATYIGGVSGSTWFMALYYSMCDCDFDKFISHIKSVMNVHIAYPKPTIDYLVSSPTAEYLLTTPIARYNRGIQPALSDMYGVLLAARLFVNRNPFEVDMKTLKTSHQASKIADGSQPLPIYSCVRHEIPTADPETPPSPKERKEAAGDNYFQWFEVTPHEFGCEELNMWIPTWSLGRQFQNGVSKGENPPEAGLSLLLGVYGSAFCATLSHYYKEIRPTAPKSAIFKWLDSIIMEKDSDMLGVHPITPSSVPNYVKGMESQLPNECPESLKHVDTIELMDAGMSNNLAIYSMLRPSRQVDVLITFDASADIHQVQWLEMVEGYAKRRGLKGWPISSANSKPLDKEKAEKMDTDPESVEKPAATATEPIYRELTPCHVYTSKVENNSEPDSDNEEIEASGITVVYFPLIPHKTVENVVPDETPFLSTWNFVYTPEEVDSVLKLAEANFAEGLQQTKDALLDAYERKKRRRLAAERVSGPPVQKHVLSNDFLVKARTT